MTLKEEHSAQLTNTASGDPYLIPADLHVIALEIYKVKVKKPASEILCISCFRDIFHGSIHNVVLQMDIIHMHLASGKDGTLRMT